MRKESREECGGVLERKRTRGGGGGRLPNLALRFCRFKFLFLWVKTWVQLHCPSASQLFSSALGHVQANLLPP